MTRRDHWSVKLPDEGPYTREQSWAKLAALVWDLRNALQRAGVEPWTGNLDGPSGLGQTEGEAISRTLTRLSTLVDPLGDDVITALASIKVKPADRIETTPLVDATMEDWHGDVAVFVRDHPECEIAALGIALIESAGYGSDIITILLGKLAEEDQDDYARMSRYYKKGDPKKDRRKIHECPRCDQTGSVGKKNCLRCHGRGYVFQTGRPEDIEYEMSDEGKLALNEGKPWTVEDEIQVLREVYEMDDDGIVDKLQLDDETCLRLGVVTEGT